MVEMDTSKLEPGMELAKDILGKSTRPMIKESTILTEKHILFMKKFMIDFVSISPPATQDNQMNSLHEPNEFNLQYNQVAQYYKRLYNNWQNNVPIDNLYEIRQQFTPLFEKVSGQSIGDFAYLLQDKSIQDNVYYKSVAMSLLAIFLAQQLKYEKKDWMQIGFSALLADTGFVKLDKAIANEKNQATPTEKFRLHPIYSYKFVEKLTTLTKESKKAILQHQELLNGTGYPAKVQGNKITFYARIIAVCDYFYQINSHDMPTIIHLLEKKKGVELEEQIIERLTNQLKNL